MLRRLRYSLPVSLGTVIGRLPWWVKLGPGYTLAKEGIRPLLGCPGEERRSALYVRLLKTLSSARREIPMYRGIPAYCDVLEGGPGGSSCADVEEMWRRLPILSKAELRQWSAHERTRPRGSRVRLNTGGTTGEPLDFYVDRGAFAREFAHIHFIWSHIGYQGHHVRLLLRGRRFGRRPLVFDSATNAFNLNPYLPPRDQVTAVGDIARQLDYIHGYPSLIQQFIWACIEHSPGLLRVLRSRLRGVLLGSEYPTPSCRSFIEEQLCEHTLSWYGHSEMAVLAYETSRYCYVPMHSYGFCEAVRSVHGGHRLVGTSYRNRVAPLIRYDTGDLVTPRFQAGILASFRVAEGRTADFISTKTGSRVSLTALIHGRHHRAFDYLRFVQVYQAEAGKATLLVVTNDGERRAPTTILSDFDLAEVDVDFDLRELDAPLRTELGKLPLLVSGVAMSAGIVGQPASRSRVSES